MIRAGADIYKIGQLVETRYGLVRVIGKKRAPAGDYFDYTVESHLNLLSPYPQPSRWSRVKEWLKRGLSSDHH